MNLKSIKIKLVLLISTLFLIFSVYSANRTGKQYIFFIKSNGPFLPVLINGHEVGMTNSLGYQYINYVGEFESIIAITLVTPEGVNLAPQNPTKLFKLLNNKIIIYKQYFAELIE